MPLLGTVPGFADDDLKHAGESDSLQSRHLGRDVRGVADGAGERDGLALDEFQHQAMDGRTYDRQIADLAAPEFRRDVSNPIDTFEDEFSHRSCWIEGVRPRTNEVA